MKHALTSLTCCLLFALAAQPAAAQVSTTAVQGIIVDVVKDAATPTGSIVVAVAPANVKYAYYEGAFLTLPTFSSLKPKQVGQMYGFDLSLALQHDNYAMAFESHLKIDKAGTYTFYLTSDDGSKLFIDNNLIVNNDGLHGPTTVTGTANLTVGMHKLQVGYFQHLGGADLRLQFEGPGLTKRGISPYLYLTANAGTPPQAQNVTFIVNETTRFETMRGNQRQQVNFLTEHRGQRVDVYQQANSKPAIAAKVDIILPLPPPTPPVHIKNYPAGPRPVFGTVVEVGPGLANTNTTAITIRLHEPPPPVVGVVKDVSVDANTGIGYVTVTATDGKDVKFTVVQSARVFKWKGLDVQAGSFLSLDKGQTVVVYPMPHHRTVTTKIDIMENPAEAAYRARYHHHHHFVTFLATPDTTFVRTRDGKNVQSNLTAVQVGEEVGIWPTDKSSHIARKVDVYLPHSIHGVITSVNPGGIGVRVGAVTKQPNGMMAFAPNAYDRLVPMNAATVVETVENNVPTPIAQSALTVGHRVVVYPAGPYPHVAEKVSIHFHHYTVKGQLVNVGQGTITLQVQQPASGTTPATTVQDMFQTSPNTKYETSNGGAITGATAAALTGAKDVVIYARDMVPPLADKIIVVLPAATPFVVTGHLVGAANNTVTLKVHHPATKTTPANHTNETFQFTQATKFEVHKGKVVEQANAGALAIKGEHRVTITGKNGTPPTADLVQIHVAAKPVTVKGHIQQIGQNAITLKVHHPANGGQPAHDTMDTIQITPMTTYELHQGKNKGPTNAGALQPGLEVHAHGQAGPQMVAERIDIHVPVPKPPPPPKAVNVTGTIVAFGNGSVQVMSKDGVVHTFALLPTTTIQTTIKGMVQPFNPAMLVPGVPVVVHGHTGMPATVDRIDVKNKK